MPKELQRRQDRLHALRKAIAELEAEAAAANSRRREQQARAAEEQAVEVAAQAHDAEAGDLSTPGPLVSIHPPAMPSRNLPTTAAGDPKANAQRNFTDPASHVLIGGDGWIHGCNSQAAGDGDHQIIVAVGVSNQASDQHHLVPMLAGSWSTAARGPRP